MSTHKACIYARNVFHINFSSFQVIFIYWMHINLCWEYVYQLRTLSVKLKLYIHIKHTFCLEYIHANNICVLLGEQYGFHRKYQYKAYIFAGNTDGW